MSYYHTAAEMCSIKKHTISLFFIGYSTYSTEPHRSQCTYLLGGDFKQGQFMLTYSSKGLTITSSKSQITITRLGAVLGKGGHHIR